MADIGTAYQWAIKTCNADNVGYSQTYRNQQTVDGITYYDCSSFIWYALQAGGYTGIGSSAFTTDTMGTILRNVGFSQYNSTAVTWRPGDIVWRSGHCEMVYSGYITMGAHTDSVPLADQVSIRSSASSATAYTYIFRPPAGNPIIDNLSGKSWVYKLGVEAHIPEADMQNNAEIMYTMCHGMGWTLNAVAALLGNCQAESALNPGTTETSAMQKGSDGTGLFQWTSTSSDATNPLLQVLGTIYGTTDNWYDGTRQMNALFAEYQQSNFNQKQDDKHDWGIQAQWINSDGSLYGFSLDKMSWYTWAHSSADLETLTKSFMVSYERPSYDASKNHWQTRVSNAQYWYSYLQGYDPGPNPPGPEPEPPAGFGTGSKWIYYMKRRRFT